LYNVHECYTRDLLYKYEVIVTKPRAGGTELFAVRFPVGMLASLKRIAVEVGVSTGSLVIELVGAEVSPSPPEAGSTRTKTILLRLTEAELAALDDYCASLRRQTGDAVTRTDTIRRAIAALVAKERADA